MTTIWPSDDSAILHEQLDYLAAHVAANGNCHCHDCQRYCAARKALLAIFEEPVKVSIAEADRITTKYFVEAA